MTKHHDLGRALTGLFDGIYIINLKSRPDRRREVRDQLGLLGLEPDRPGISFFEAVRPDDATGWPSIGAKGCFASHQGVLRAALAADVSRLLILEDDVDWTPAFLSHGQDLIGALGRTDWGFVHGGHGQAPGADGPISVVPVPPDQGLGLTHFIALTREVIPRVESYLADMAARPPGDPRGGPMHVDGAYSWFRRDNPDVVSLILEPSAARQRSSVSDIADPKWFDRVPVLSASAAVARRLANRFGQR